MQFRSLFAIGALLLGTTQAPAQETWTTRASGTTERLWGVAEGDGQFVAVGDHGTVLTSRDAVNWRFEFSGTSVALLAVARISGQFVAVGEEATVLVSKDGATWRKIDVVAGPAGTKNVFQPRRLNAVAALPWNWNGELSDLATVSAAGEDGVAAWGHPIDRKWSGVTRPGAGWIRGIAWGHEREVRVGRDGVLLVPASSRTEVEGSNHVAAPLSPRRGANLEAIVFARGQFVAVGQRGAVVVSSDAVTWAELPSIATSHLFGLTFFNDEFVAVGEGGTIFRSADGRSWGRAESGVTAALRAAAASATTLVAVGDGGAIVTSGIAPKAVQFVSQPAAATTNVGGAAGFRVTVAGSPPFAYQWWRDGVAVPGATDAVFGIFPATIAHAGSYRVRVSNAAGTAISAAAALVVEPAPAKPIVDDTFRADPSLAGTPTALLPLADGRIVVALQKREAPIIDPFAAEVVRLLPNGRVDPTFRRAGVAAAEFAWRPTFYLPSVQQLILQPDGGILVTGYFGIYDGLAVPGMVRVHSDGSVDPTFHAAIVSPDRPRRDGDFTDYAPTAAVQTDGRIVYITAHGAIARLLPSGETDASFHVTENFFIPRVLAVSPNGRIFVGGGGAYMGTSGFVAGLLDDGRSDPAFPRYACEPVEKLSATADGGVLVGTRWDTGPLFPGSSRPTRFPTKTFRLRADGTLDPTLPVRDVALAAPPAPDGGLLFTNGRLIKPDGVTETQPSFGADYAYVGVRQFALDGRLWVGGAFSVYNGTPTQGIARLDLDASEQLAPPRILAAWSEPAVVWPGEPVTFHVVANAPGPVTFSLMWNPANVVATAAVPELTVPGWNSGTYAVQVSNSAGSARSEELRMVFASGDARVVRQAHRVSLTNGRYFDSGPLVELSPAFHPIRIEWQRDGVPVDGPPGGRVDATQAGTYTATFTDVLGNTVSIEPIVVTVNDGSRFANLSTRAMVGAGEAAPILGFTIPDGQWRDVLVRGVGPSLARFGVEAPLSAARLEIFRADGGLLARTNVDDSHEDGRLGAFPLAVDGGDAAMWISLGPGSYTARLSGIGAATGPGLIELYETGTLSDRFSNMSSRVLVNPTVEGTAIAGFAIRGAAPKRMLIRAAGPALTPLGVENVLRDPKFEVRDAAGRLLFANDDWDRADAAGVMEATAAVGAFPFAAGSRDAALVITLAPGNYTALIGGTGATSGVALVEVYELP